MLSNTCCRILLIFRKILTRLSEHEYGLLKIQFINSKTQVIVKELMGKTENILTHEFIIEQWRKFVNRYLELWRECTDIMNP